MLWICPEIQDGRCKAGMCSHSIPHEEFNKCSTGEEYCNDVGKYLVCIPVNPNRKEEV